MVIIFSQNLFLIIFIILNFYLFFNKNFSNKIISKILIFLVSIVYFSQLKIDFLDFKIITILIILNLFLAIWLCYRIEFFQSCKITSYLTSKTQLTSQFSLKDFFKTKNFLFLLIVFLLSVMITSAIFFTDFNDFAQAKQQKISENQQNMTSQFDNIYQIKQQRIRAKIKDSFLLKIISEITLISAFLIIFSTIWQSQKNEDI